MSQSLLKADIKFDGLPLYVKDQLTCTIKEHKDKAVFYSSLSPVGPDGRYLNPEHARSIPLGAFCLICNKPTKYTIANVVEICDECDAYYVPPFKAEEYPVRWRMCKNCGG